MILIHVSQGAALVWSAEEARQLRERHGLCGTPVGGLARQPRQNGRLGLPLRLLPEEARLAAESGSGVLVRGRAGAEARAEEEEREHRERAQRSHQEQRRLALQEKRSSLQGLAERIRQGRANKRKRISGETGELGPEAGEDDRSAPLKELEELERSFTFPPESCLVQIHTVRLGPRNLEVLDWRSASEDWPHPGDPRHALRYSVFKDLRAQGYHLTSAGKFGGDFLVYPGDPMRYHAHYIAICVPYKTDLPLQDTVTAGRLGSNVKKTVLLCSVTEAERIVYTSLRWSGIQ
uniref:tRNA-splicing endonuclease subunit Sen34-like n=1 Tax=Pristiophorus japonicus TaxID=55135 RepID=UPI00398E6ED3